MLAPAVTALSISLFLATLPTTMNAGRTMDLKDEGVDISMSLLVNVNKGGETMTAALKVIFV